MNAHARFSTETGLLDRARLAERRVKEAEVEICRLRAIIAHHEALFSEASPIQAIIIATCEHFGVPKMVLTGSHKCASVVLPRQAAMYLAREMTPLSFAVIGRFFGGRDHTTVIHAVQRMAGMIRNGRPVTADVAAIRARLKAGRAGA